jgi:hypothetical protein
MSLIETDNTKDILKKKSPWGAPNKNNKQPSSNTPDDREDLAKKFQDGLKNRLINIGINDYLKENYNTPK